MKLDKRRLPSYPIFVKDPYFSFWSAGDEVNKTDTVFWHGEKKPIYGTVNVGGQTYAFLGMPENALPLKQTAVELTAFSTIYTFSHNDFVFRAEFLSPLPPDNIELASCPVCYCIYKIISAKPLGKVTVTLAAEERICYNTCYEEDRREEVRCGTMNLDGFECAYMGLRRQMPMSHTHDEFSADWGYYYVAGQKAFATETDGRRLICASDTFFAESDTEGFLMFALDDLCSIFYFGEWLKGYWFRNGRTIIDALSESRRTFNAVSEECARFDKLIVNDAKKYGEDYLFVLYAGLRQTMAAHKIVETTDKKLLFLSKECNSDGCIATVDISYPSMPVFLLYNASLIRGMLEPIFKFARMPVWRKNFAPHDAGVYPYCLGQFYAAKYDTPETVYDFQFKDLHKQESLPMFYIFPDSDAVYDESRQMPVEECGNMLIMSAMLRAEDDGFLAENADILNEWCNYLVENGLIPANQLCTDDFAGHLEKNANLAIKAIMGIKAYSVIAQRLGRAEESKKFMAIAQDYAKKWISLYASDRPSVLALGLKGSYSLKYNLAIDVLFGNRLFPTELCEAEAEFYLENLKRYGPPLDSRALYTKSDWILWSATLTADTLKRKKFVRCVADFLTETPDRVPFSDWYDSADGSYCMFRNRTVQGGLFILALADKLG